MTEVIVTVKRTMAAAFGAINTTYAYAATGLIWDFIRVPSMDPHISGITGPGFLDQPRRLQS